MVANETRSLSRTRPRLDTQLALSLSIELPGALWFWTFELLPGLSPGGHPCPLVGARRRCPLLCLCPPCRVAQRRRPSLAARWPAFRGAGCSRCGRRREDQDPHSGTPSHRIVGGEEATAAAGVRATNHSPRFCLFFPPLRGIQPQTRRTTTTTRARSLQPRHTRIVPQDL